MEIEIDNPTVRRFINVMDSLTKRMINCELIHFELVLNLLLPSSCICDNFKYKLEFILG